MIVIVKIILLNHIWNIIINYKLYFVIIKTDIN